jgi:hypothetical protein
VQHLIAPFLVFLKWLRVKKVSTKIATTRLTRVFSYSTNTAATSRLITPVRLGNSTRPYIPRAINLSLSTGDPYSVLFYF